MCGKLFKDLKYRWQNPVVTGVNKQQQKKTHLSTSLDHNNKTRNSPYSSWCVMEALTNDDTDEQQ